MPSKAQPVKLPIIGWREWVQLPELGIAKIKAKIDTGARSSSLHAYDLKYEERDGKQWVRFKVHPRQRNTTEQVVAESPVLEFRKVRSSNGQVTKRPVILTKVELLGELFEIEITLANRDSMGFRMLLGREAYRGRMLVDSGASYLSGVPKRLKGKRNASPTATKRPSLKTEHDAT
ncbi:ATP-dependent zinc protease family protein [Bremerella sp. P1]|uniref:ATP-dependent zinc protease family protein n=1 Tax=Bremerella sp. P1 TaxID=3026424 RepID=UPI0023688611|nr:ATP-dependent zinc protease [Bremerella sp. P1]WDI40735.1 ATP-dependent zinc protease [Bremerella sp. P1]